MFRILTAFYFVVGFILGVLTFIFVSFNYTKYKFDFCAKEIDINKEKQNAKYEEWFSKSYLVRHELDIDSVRYSNKSIYSEAQYLYDTIKVLCIIMVRNEKNFKAASETWAKGCNGIYTVNLINENKKMPVRKTKQNSSWAFLCKTLISVRDSYDWYLVVNDNTFAVMENLRLLVAPLNPQKGHYLGHAVTFWSTIYNVGQAGYVISVGALKPFKKIFNSEESCTANTTYLNQEDFYLGKVFSSLNIFPSDTRDALGLSTFHSYNWQHEFFPTVNYYKNSVYPVVCCSAQSITFQAIESEKMHMYYYLLYQLQLFTSGKLGNKPVPPVPDEVIWRSFLDSRGLKNTIVNAEEYYKIWLDIVHDPTIFAREVAANKYEYYDER